MLNHTLYTRRELAVYPEAMAHFLKGVPPTMMVQIFLFLITGFLYYDYVPHVLRWAFGIVLIGIAIFLVLFSRHMVYRGTWCRQL